MQIFVGYMDLIYLYQNCLVPTYTCINFPLSSNITPRPVLKMPHLIFNFLIVITTVSEKKPPETFCTFYHLWYIGSSAKYGPSNDVLGFQIGVGEFCIPCETDQGRTVRR